MHFKLSLKNRIVYYLTISIDNHHFHIVTFSLSTQYVFTVITHYLAFQIYLLVLTFKFSHLITGFINTCFSHSEVTLSWSAWEHIDYEKCTFRRVNWIGSILLLQYFNQTNNNCGMLYISFLILTEWLKGWNWRLSLLVSYQSK